jgi:hypothetical protein
MREYEYPDGRAYQAWNSLSCGITPDRRPYDFDERSGLFVGIPSGLYSPNTSDLLAKATNNASSEFYSNATTAQATGLTMLGELRETLSMLRHPYKGSYQLLITRLQKIREFRIRGRVKKEVKKRIVDDYVSNWWLETMFGWRPLLSDAEDAVTAAVRLQNQIELKPIHGESTETSCTVSAEQVGSVMNYCRYFYNDRDSRTVMVKYRGAVRLQLYSDAPLAATAETFGFSLEQFVPTVWELIPYSFVVDYFSNVGACLSAASFGTGNLAWACQSVRVENEYSRNYRGDGGAYIKQALGPRFREDSFYCSPYVNRQFDFSRTRGAPPVPSLRFQLPGSPLKWVNLAALGDQMRRSSNHLRSL